jgi:hypothetical protein
LQSHKQNTNLAETQPDGTCFDNKPNWKNWISRVGKKIQEILLVIQNETH